YRDDDEIDVVSPH
nr:Chain C, DIM GAMMA-TUBULIN 1 [Drosophila melanogaster]